MSSFIHYRFVSSANAQKLTFEGASIPLWELRTEIINVERMTAKDFDLLFFIDDNQLTNESTPVYRNTTVIVKRIPIWMSKTTIEPKKHSKYVPRLPPNYICFRCGQKGHFIQHCPTNDDKNYDLLRIRKATGIPKDFLKPVKEKEGTSLLVTQEGSYVQAQPQIHMFKVHGQINVSSDRLVCKYCTSLMNEPVSTECGHTFCKNCVIFNECVVCGRKVGKIMERGDLGEEIERYVENG